MMNIQKSFHWSYAVVLGLLAVSVSHPEWHLELAVFRAPDRPLMYPFYALPVFRFLGLVPEPVAYGLLSVWTVGTMIAAVRLFGGKSWMVNTSFSFLWLLLFGQTDGLAAGGVVIAWFALQKNRPYLLGLGLILASIKPMTAGLILLLWWWSPSRMKSLVIPLIVVAASFVAYGFWIPEWVNIILGQRSNIEGASWNYSLWPLLGAWVWLLWPVILALRLDRIRKLIAVGAVSMMTVPYFPFYSALIFYAMPVPGFFYWISQLLMLGTLLGPVIVSWMRLLPIALLVWAVYPLIVPARWQENLAGLIRRKAQRSTQ